MDKLISISELSKKLKDKLLVYTFPKPDNFISPPNLFLKNGLDRKDLLDKLLSAKVHISLSPQEGFSLVAYESIKCGCVPLSLASTELSKYIEEYLNKKIKSIDDLISISTTISNYNEKEYNSLIKYLDDQIKSLPFFYKSINKLTLNDLLKTLDSLSLLLENGATFVHCHASIERSPFVCIAWLVYKEKIKPEFALKHLMNVHPLTCPLNDHLILLKEI